MRKFNKVLNVTVFLLKSLTADDVFYEKQLYCVNIKILIQIPFAVSCLR